MPNITASLQERIKYIRMPSPVYQYVINLVVGLPIRTGSGVLVNRAVTTSFDVANFTVLTPLLLLFLLF